MNPPTASSTRLLPLPHERTAFANILFLLGLPFAAYLAYLLAISGTEEVHLFQEGTVAVLTYAALSLGALIGWRRLRAQDSWRDRLIRTHATAQRLAASAFRAGRAYPVATLWLAALAGVLVSCYPVVFGGKSFVSPNEMWQLFYERQPTLPDSTSTKVVDAHGSDVAAMSLAHRPYSVVENRAIFRDGELPLWNRYSAGGASLIGQGQSMLGDPLHLLVVLAGGGAGAWDLKFLAARLLFAAGLGLCVRRATGRLGAAALLAFSACFFGFFLYRLNHAATFSVCYAPWILLAWLGIVRGTDGRDRGLRGKLRWTALLLLACWMELNSGTAKESTFLLLCLNAVGLVVLLLDDRRTWRWKGLALAGLAWVGVGFVLLSAPFWRTLLREVTHSWSNYMTPHAWQIQPGLLIGLFDDIFYRPFNQYGHVFDPSLNFVVLLGLAFAVTSCRVLIGRHRLFLSLSLSALLPLALVFGIISPQWICSVPFLGNVTHVDNTFSCVLVVLLPVLAGFGLERCRERLGARDWAWDYAAAAAVLLGLLGLFFGLTQAQQRSDVAPSTPVEAGLPLTPFFHGYVPVIVLAFLALPLLWRTWRRGGSALAWGVAPWVAVCLGALLWRGGIQEEGVVGWEQYVMHLGPRTNLTVHSPGLDRLHALIGQEPGRAMGFGNTLPTGFAAALGIETPSGPDALQNPYFHELIARSHTPFIYNWKLATTQGVVASPARRFYDLLNVRYYAGTIQPHTATGYDVPGLRSLGRTDLDLWESPTAWPRAFFTDALVPNHDVDTLYRTLMTGDGRPFAAVLPDEIQIRPDAAAFAPILRGPGEDAARTVVPATGYRLTSRTTSFHLRAPCPGIAVVMEGYQQPFNVRFTLDGKPVPYLRIDEAFMGILIPAAGDHEVRVVYGPTDLPLLLGLSALGLVLLVGAAVVVLRFDRGRVRVMEPGLVPSAVPRLPMYPLPAPVPALTDRDDESVPAAPAHAGALVSAP